MMDLDDLELELAWFTRVLALRFQLYFGQGDAPPEARAITDLAPPELGDSTSPWASFVRERPLTLVERLALVLALVPHLRPQLLDVFFTKNATFDRRFTEFGGARIDDEFEPTGETLAFVLGGGSLEARVAVAQVLDPDHPFVRGEVVRPVPMHRDQPPMKAPLRISPEYLGLLTTGQRL
ncbi:MAG TPA: hypothetical protein VNM90_17265, partial [Haliangium sp.]|nr:hypothetical protein [Haliangium sp.]